MANTYYRIAIAKNNGQVEYSEVLELGASDRNGSLQLYPNPSVDFVKLDLNLTAEVDADITLYDLSGRVVETLSVTTGLAPLEISAKSLETGTYLIQASYMGKTELRVFSKK